jgi:hypothetical protein
VTELRTDGSATQATGDGWALPGRSHLSYEDRIRTVLFEACTAA